MLSLCGSQVDGKTWDSEILPVVRLTPVAVPPTQASGCGSWRGRVQGG
jgi:hypothetical protein